jgi:hypothetical protein
VSLKADACHVHVGQPSLVPLTRAGRERVSKEQTVCMAPCLLPALLCCSCIAWALPHTEQPAHWLAAGPGAPGAHSCPPPFLSREPCFGDAATMAPPLQRHSYTRAWPLPCPTRPVPGRRLPSKLAADPGPQGGRLALVGMCDVGTLNQVVELWRYPSATHLIE